MTKILQGDCLEVMRTMADNSVETIITDPPYGLSFMGKKRDYDVPSVEIRKEALRVLKPGGTALIFAGSRTQHRMACNVEDAGFLLKDTIMWMYGSGFPKATDISKQLDKNNGRSLQEYKELGEYLKKERGDKPQKEISKFFPSKTGGLTGCVSNWESGSNVPTKKQRDILKKELLLDDRFDKLIERVEAEREVIGNYSGATSIYTEEKKTMDSNVDITAPSTPEAQLRNGRKSHGLKPSYEPILVCQKPNDGTYASNALKWGVSGLNIDGGRVESGLEITNSKSKGGNKNKSNSMNELKEIVYEGNPQGRFPANIILDEEAGRMLDEQSGELKSGELKGGASRFFYCAKASKKERNAGYEELEEKQVFGDNGGTYQGLSDSKKKSSNSHPTVKPLKLMEYLCTLTKTPTGGVVLDPFAGSGTTGLACKNTGRDCILIEREEDYIKIIEKRLQTPPSE